MVRAKKVKPALVLELPGVRPTNDRFVIVGLDPSLSKSGVAIRLVEPSGSRWLYAGSIKPEETSDPAWIRSQGMGKFLTQLIKSREFQEFISEPCTMILSFEAPTMGNDFLNTASLMLRSELLRDRDLLPPEIFSLMVNASTMRSVMGLVQTGAKNKEENKAKAWNYIPMSQFPGLDSDACDAVLFCVLAEWVTTVFTESIEGADVPNKFKERFFDSTLITKGKGKNAYQVPNGVMLNSDYWSRLDVIERVFGIKDARTPKGKRLEKISFLI